MDAVEMRPWETWGGGGWTGRYRGKVKSVETDVCHIRLGMVHFFI